MDLWQLETVTGTTLFVEATDLKHAANRTTESIINGRMVATGVSLGVFQAKRDVKKFQPRSKRVLFAVAANFEVPVKYITGLSRAPSVVIARDATAYLLREGLSKTFIEIGKILNRNHSSIMTSVKRAESRCQKDTRFVVAVGKLWEALYEERVLSSPPKAIVMPRQLALVK